MAFLGRFGPKLPTGFRGTIFPPLGGASRAPGCPPSASPSPKGVFRAAARTRVGAKSAPFETPCVRGHFKLRFLAPPSPHKVF
jgi:hypothetical protein